MWMCILHLQIRVMCVYGSHGVHIFVLVGFGWFVILGLRDSCGCSVLEFWGKLGSGSFDSGCQDLGMCIVVVVYCYC